MLKRMQRRVASAGRCASWSASSAIASRDSTLRTTFITGFPGETDEDFRRAVRVRRGSSSFERLGVFTYSLEPDTPAARLAEPPARRRSRTTRRERADGDPAADRVRVGRRADRPRDQTVLIDTPTPDRADRLHRPHRGRRTGRRLRRLRDGRGPPAGRPGRVRRSSRAHDYDLVAVAVGEPR